MASPYSINKNKYLLDDELQALETVLAKHASNDTRNVLIIRLGLLTGARASELLAITKQDLSDGVQSVFIKGLKDSNDREIPLPASFYTQLRVYAQSIDGPLLFDISYNRLYQVWQTYKPVKKSFHCLRHTFAINLYKRTKDIRLVQVALGHRNIANTMVYADYIYNQQEMRRLIA